MDFNDINIILGFIFGIVLFYNLPQLKVNRLNNDDRKYLVSVEITVRNEEDNLPNILGDIQKQTYNMHQIIYVDDNSEDNTLSIIDSFGVEKVELKGLPHRWKGKPWALQNGAKKATGELLLFIDKDVRLSNTTVESLVKRYLGNNKPISIQPYHIVKKQHEYFSVFFNIIQIFVTGMSVFGIKKKSGFYGPVLMMSKELFDKYGGYELVKNNVVEDYNLGRYYNKMGTDIDLVMGAKEIQFQMYPKSFGNLFDGWSKNFSMGSISMQWWLLAIVIVWVTFITALPIEIIKSAVEG